MTQSAKFMRFLETNSDKVCKLTNREDREEAFNEFFKLLSASTKIDSDTELKRTRLILMS